MAQGHGDGDGPPPKSRLQKGQQARLLSNRSVVPLPATATGPGSKAASSIDAPSRLRTSSADSSAFTDRHHYEQLSLSVVHLALIWALLQFLPTIPNPFAFGGPANTPGG